MPIEIIDDPKTGEKRRVYVSTGGMGTGAPPKPRPQPQPPAGGGFMGTLNDFNPMKQIGALGTGVSTFMQTGDLNKSIAAASRKLHRRRIWVEEPIRPWWQVANPLAGL
jgi:hypothetical protein